MINLILNNRSTEGMLIYPEAMITIWVAISKLGEIGHVME